MGKRPGGALVARPLHFIWIVDTSGSMSVDGKIEALNLAIRKAVPHMQDVAEDNPNASVLMRCLRFSHGADWHIDDPIPVADFAWTDLEADELVGSSGAANLDIIFLVDTSGSMSGEINSVKQNCLAFADHIIKEGVEVRLGLIGFDIGGHRGGRSSDYKVYNLSRYTIGIWPLTAPRSFQKNVQSLSLCLFGGSGCYIANSDTVDIFPHIVNSFDQSSERQRILVIVSDEMGDNSGRQKILRQLLDADIKTHVLGVPGRSGAHETIVKETGGQFWDITSSQGKTSFDGILEDLADTIAKEATKTLADGIVSQGTDMGIALEKIAAEMRTPPMPDRALPPVLVMVSDGQPTDDFRAGLKVLMDEPWSKKAMRIAIGIGEDANPTVLQEFIGRAELKPLQANNPEVLTEHIRWASTAVLSAASSPVASAEAGGVPVLHEPEVSSADDDIW